MKKLKSYSTTIAIAALYFFLFAGGLWHVLGVFQTLMRLLAAPLLIALSIIAFAVIFKILPDQQSRWRLLGWSMLVIIASFWIEWLGVKTGKIFGNYAYGETLQPILLGVPIAIGFAWLCMLLTSTAVVQRILPKFSSYHFILQAISISLLMVLFDIVMEPAAMKLGYWTWLGDSIPIQNFIAWFMISFIFAIIGLRLRLFQAKLPAIVFHAYFAQLVYFGMVILK
ncbi:MAG: carotenoid biosynthesis protein [candidate division KSB1 bacterium]|nr:carotenoid biosynthesis protein [candidate division KSB1 bacterium]